MSREIKFRGKTTIAERWVYGSLLIDWAGTTQIWEKDSDGSLHNYIVDPESVGQYTGLKDKHGVEIYEGDVDCHNWVVFYDSESAGYKLRKNNRIRALHYSLRKYNNHIIGNIYENPELLEDKL